MDGGDNVDGGAVNAAEDCVNHEVYRSSFIVHCVHCTANY